MKKWLIIVLMLLFTLVGYAQEETVIPDDEETIPAEVPAKNELIPKVGAGGISFGNTIEEVKNVWGKPEFEYELFEVYQIEYRFFYRGKIRNYFNLFFTKNDEDKYILKSIEVVYLYKSATGVDMQLKQDLSIDDISVQKINEIYGKPKKIGNPHIGYRYLYNEYQLEFQFDEEEKIHKVVINNYQPKKIEEKTKTEEKVEIVEEKEYIPTLEEIATLTGHSDGVYYITYSPIGDKIFSTSKDNTIKVWDAETKEEITTIEGFTETVRNIAFSPDNKQFAVAGGYYDDENLEYKSGFVQIYDTETYELIKEIKDFSYYVQGLCYSPDGSFLAAGSGNYDYENYKFTGGIIKLIDTGNYEITDTIETSNIVLSLKYSPSGKFLITGNGDDYLAVLDAENNFDEIAATEGGYAGDACNVIFFDSENQYFVTIDNLYNIVFYDLNNFQASNYFNPRHGKTYALSISNDNKYIITGGSDNAVRLWNAGNLEETDIVESHTDLVQHASFSPDNKYIASSSEDGLIKIYEIKMIEKEE